MINTVNQRGCEVLGQSRDRIIGKNWFDTFIPDRDRNKVVKGFQMLMKGNLEHTEYFENVVVVRDGEERIIAWHNAILRNESGEIIGTLSSGEDITERKRTEAQIVKLNQDLCDRAIVLEELNKELEAFNYTVSHDLRSPLRHIDAFLKLLKERIGENIDDKSEHYIHTICNATQKMGQLISDLLAFSKMGRRELQKTSIDLDKLVSEIIDEQSASIAGRTINWQIGNIPRIYGDRTLIRAVLVNLISNAVKFSRPRTEAVIEIGSNETENATTLFIRDNGVGFDMAYADKLFGVFQRLHRTDEFEGTGIGLANVKKIVQRHGGRVWYEAKLDRGATFYCAFPKSSH